MTKWFINEKGSKTQRRIPKPVPKASQQTLEIVSGAERAAERDYFPEEVHCSGMLND